MEVDKIKIPLHKAVEIAFDDVNTRMSGETNLLLLFQPACKNKSFRTVPFRDDSHRWP